MADLPYALSISPDSALQFNLTPDADNGDGASRCIMTLTHPRKDGKGGGYLAFKVRRAACYLKVLLLPWINLLNIRGLPVQHNPRSKRRSRGGI